MKPSSSNSTVLFYFLAACCVLSGVLLLSFPNNIKAPANLPLAEQANAKDTSEDNAPKTLWYDNATELEEEGQYEEALSSYVLAKEQAPESLPVLLGEVRMHSKLGNHFRALELMVPLVKQFPMSEAVQFAYLRELFATDGSSDAYLYATNQEIASAYPGIGCLLEATQKNMEGIQTYCEATLATSSPFRSFAETLLEQTKAYETFSDGKDEYIWTLNSKVLIEAGLLRPAMNILHEITDKAPDYRDPWVLKGYTYLAERQYEDAKNALIKAYELDTTHTDTQFLLGQAYDLLGDVDKAIVYYSLALDNKYTKEAFLFERLLFLAKREQRFDLLLGLYEKSPELKRPETYLDLFWILLEVQGDTQRAYDQLAGLRARGLSDPYLALYQSWIRLSENKINEAESFVVSLDQNIPLTSYLFGRILEVKEQYNDAKRYYQQVFEANATSMISIDANKRYSNL